MDPGLVQMDLLYGDLAEGLRLVDLPRLRFEDCLQERHEAGQCRHQHLGTHSQPPENLATLNDRRVGERRELHQGTTLGIYTRAV